MAISHRLTRLPCSCSGLSDAGFLWGWYFLPGPALESETLVSFSFWVPFFSRLFSLRPGKFVFIFKKYLIVWQETGSYVITAFYPILVFISQKCLSALGSGFENHNSFSFPESAALSRNFKIVFSCSKGSLSLSSALPWVHAEGQGCLSAQCWGRYLVLGSKGVKSICTCCDLTDPKAKLF